MPNFNVLTEGIPAGLPEDSINPTEGPPEQTDNEELVINQQEGEK